MSEALAIGPEQRRIALRSLLVADGIALIHNRRSLVMSILVPVLLLVITDRSNSSLGTPLGLIALSIAIGLLSTSIMGYSIATARDRDAGVFQRLRVTPAPTWMIMASRLGVQAGANLILTLAVLIVGSAIHGITVSPGRYILVLLISIFAGAVFLSIGQALVGLVRSADTINATARLLYIGLLLIGLWGETGQLGQPWDVDLALDAGGGGGDALWRGARQRRVGKQRHPLAGRRRRLHRRLRISRHPLVSVAGTLTARPARRSEAHAPTGEAPRFAVNLTRGVPQDARSARHPTAPRGSADEETPQPRATHALD